jgi:hypothetical protein
MKTIPPNIVAAILAVENSDEYKAKIKAIQGFRRKCEPALPPVHLGKIVSRYRFPSK